MDHPAISLLVTDIDNTLFDWVSSWAACVPGLVADLASELGIGPGEAERRVRTVHRAWGRTECPSCVATLVADRRACERIIRGYERRFSATAPVFDDVPDTLRRVRASGARVAAYTESHRGHTLRRLTLLGLADLVDIVYSDQRKPDPATLQTIASEARTEPGRMLYVGDNLWKDVAMAERAGVHAAWARYGTRRSPDAEAWLERLCHWTPSDTAAERDVASAVSAPIVLERGLAELFDRFRFVPHD